MMARQNFVSILLLLVLGTFHATEGYTTGIPATTRNGAPIGTVGHVATTREVATGGPAVTTTDAPPSGLGVTCDSTSMTLFLDKNLLENGGTADEVHYEDLDCTGYDYDAERVAITTRYDECLTKSEQTLSVIKFTNEVTYFKPKGVNGSVITRTFRMKIPVICELNRRSLLGNNFKPKLGVVAFTEVGYGNFSLSLNRYADTTFTQPPADLAAEIYLGEEIYFGANLTAVTDLTLLLDRCWATPDVYPMTPTSYTFIKDGCKVDDTVDFYNNLGPLTKGFSIDAFAFIGEYPEVYIHCDVLVCDNGDPASRCAQGCLTRSKRSAGGSRGSSSKPHTVSNGPLSDHGAVGSSSGDSSWLSSPVNMMLIGAAGFFIAMVAMVTVRKFVSRGEPNARYIRLATEEA